MRKLKVQSRRAEKNAEDAGKTLQTLKQTSEEMQIRETQLEKAEASLSEELNDLTLQVKATQVDKSALTGAARKELAELEKLVKTLQNNIEQKNEGMLQAQHKQARPNPARLPSRSRGTQN